MLTPNLSPPERRPLQIVRNLLYVIKGADIGPLNADFFADARSRFCMTALSTYVAILVAEREVTKRRPSSPDVKVVVDRETHSLSPVVFFDE